MRIPISADMEGACGVVSSGQGMPPEAATTGRPTAAAIEGAPAGGATDFVVADGHDLKRNLLPDELYPACRLIAGDDRPLGWPRGGPRGRRLPLLHRLPRQGRHPRAPLAQASTTWVHDLCLDGGSTGEFGLNAAAVGHFGVPVALVAGDDEAVAQTRDRLAEAVFGAVVKGGISTFAALHLHPERAWALIRAGVEAAVRRAAGLSPWRLPAGCRVEVAFDHQARADQAVLVPRVEKSGPREVAWEAADGRHMTLVYRAVL